MANLNLVTASILKFLLGALILGLRTGLWTSVSGLSIKNFNKEKVILASCADFGISGSGVVREWKVFQQVIELYKRRRLNDLKTSRGCSRYEFF